MTRSNRQLTQFAVDKLHSFLSDGNAFLPGSAGNTAVALRFEGDFSVLTFTLFDRKILEVFFDGQYCSHVVVHSGDFFDHAGRPSRTTRERLNGILDALGEECLIPERVRVHLDAEDREKCFVGRLGVRRPLGRGLAPVTILADQVRLQFDQ